MTGMLPIAAWCFAASLFLPLFAWALMPLLPRCAATRHLVWLALFVVLLVLPVLAPLVPPQIVLPAAVEAAPSAPAIRAAASHGWSMADAVPFLILTWLAGILFHLARLGLGLFGLHRLFRDSLPFDDRRDVRLADEGPLAFGGFRPLILLPHAAAHWPQNRLDAVLAHERAHLRRRDCLTQMLARLVCAFYWPNLLLWLAARSMRRQAEIAADNAVLAGGMRASDYAAELLQLAGQSLRLPAVAMAAPSLEARVRSVLSPEPSRQGVGAMDVFKIVWLGTAAAVALAFARPAIAQAEAVPLPPMAPAAAPAQAAPAQAASPAPPARPAHHHHHIRVSIDADGLSAADKVRIDAAVARARADMARAQPQIDRAMHQAQAEHAAAQSVQQAMPQVRAAIAQAMAQIKPIVHQALVNERVDVKVSVVLDRAQAQIDQAIAHAERDAQRNAEREADPEAARAARTYHRDANPDEINPNP
jgi:hypothetical protein